MVERVEIVSPLMSPKCDGSLVFADAEEPRAKLALEEPENKTAQSVKKRSPMTCPVAIFS